MDGFEDFDYEDAKEHRRAVALPVEPAPKFTSRTNREYLHLVHPVTGLEVVFVPGEALPQWAWDALTEQESAAAAKTTPPARGKGRKGVNAGKYTKAPPPDVA